MNLPSTGHLRILDQGLPQSDICRQCDHIDETLGELTGRKAMIADLRADSQRWRQEQRSTGTRGSHSPVMLDKSGCTVPDRCIGPYEASSTYHQSSAGRVQRRDADSPSLESPYQGMPPSRERLPSDRRPPPADAMQIDPPSAPQPDRRGYAQPGRGGYPQDSRGFAPQQDSRNYPQDTMMQDTYGRPPVTSSYASDPRYAPSYPQQGNDAVMSGFGRPQPPPGNYYPTPATSSYESMPAMLGRPQDPSQYPGAQYGQPQQQPGRQDHYREQRGERPDPRDPRYAGRGYDPRDPSDAYPSPAATVSSVNARDREPITSPPNPRFAYSRPSFRRA